MSKQKVPSSEFHTPRCDCTGTRREFLWQTGAGFSGLAMASLLDAEGFFAKQGYAATAGGLNPLAPRAPHIPTKAKSCIFLFMFGGPSQLDTFDYKPELQKRDGQSVSTELRRGSVQQTKLLASRRQFKQYGQSGLWCSDAFPKMSAHMDKMAMIKSLYSDSFAHGSAMLQINSGRILQGHPAIGSWLTYGLGSENQNLPGFVVMTDPIGGPISGAVNWGSGYMPAAYQGTLFRSVGEPILDLQPPSDLTAAMQSQQIAGINALNTEHLKSHPGYSELQARIASYELAFQLQSTAPEVLDLSTEDARTLEMYGVNEPLGPSGTIGKTRGPAIYGRQCLIARRLVERGVRFVQLYSGGSNQQLNWDAHQGQEDNIAMHCPEVDQPIAALLTDLEQRGLLDETLVIWGGEFGRQPVSQGENNGRDHNPKGFTYWMAGAGVKPGISYGETDPLGHEAVTNRHHIRDLHATILHLMGLDHHKLTYFYGGLNQKLTGVQPAKVIEGILA
jgi:hypothetical protein